MNRRGITITELLVALAVGTIFIAGVAGAFIQVIRASDEAKAQIRSSAAARAAAEKIGGDLRSLQFSMDPRFQEFRLVNNTLPYGDNINNDRDGATDEELPDGFDNDFDWTVAHDRHAMIGLFTERERFVNVADFGDGNVDEDVRFSSDEVTFIILPGPGIPRQRVTYRLGTFDGVDNVLVRAVTVNPTEGGHGTDPEEVEPLAFEVVSFNVLAWNANSDAVSPAAGQPYWVEEWNAADKNFPTLAVLNSPFGTPPFKVPAAFLITLHVSAEDQRLSDIADWPNGNRPLKTTSTTTVVTVEEVTHDNRYREYIRE